MTPDEAKRLLAEHGSQYKAAAAAGVSRMVIRRALKRGKAGAGASEPRPTRARSIADFRAAYDKETIVPAKVGAALKALGSGWLYETEFVREAGVSHSDLSMFRDRYAAHVVNARDRRIWVGNTKVAETMRGML